MGRKTTTAMNIRFNVRWLEVASKAVRLLLGTVLDGIMNGNIDNVAVRMTPAKAALLNINAIPGRLAREMINVSIPPAMARIGANIIHG